MLISQLSREQNVSKDIIEKRAMAILDRVADQLNHQTARTLAYFMRKAFTTLYDCISINDEAFERLWYCFRRPRSAVIIVPSHRSYVDFIVVSYTLMVMGFPLPHICTGEDFLGLGKLSEMLRGSGAFFMRRSFRGDRLYGALFKEYVRHLVRDARCIEFFIEGTRSRTGKTLPPKLGILKMITDSFLERQEEIDDVLFVPVSLSYEKLLEGNVYANELLGIPKPKETVANLFKAATVLRSNYGSFNVVVGEPISLAEVVETPRAAPAPYESIPAPNAAKEVAANGASITAASIEEGKSHTPPLVLNALAWRITHSLQQNLTVTPTALLAAVLLNMHRTPQLQNGIPVALIASEVEWLRTILLRSGGKMNVRLAKLDGAQLVSAGIRHLNPSVWLSPFSQVFLTKEQSTAATMLLSIYTNQLMHVFGDTGIVCAAMWSLVGRQHPQLLSGNSSVAPPTGAVLGVDITDAGHLGRNSPRLRSAEVATLAFFLRELLAFVLPNHFVGCPFTPNSWLRVTEDTLRSNKALLQDDSLQEPEAEEIRIFSLNAYSSFAAQMVYPYIETFFLVVLATTPLIAMERVLEGSLLAATHRLGVELCEKGSIDYVQACNKEELKSAITRLLSLDVLGEERSPSGSLTLKKLFRDDSGKQLLELLRKINAVRWHPASPATLQKLIDAAAQLIQPSKL
jgi:glycerone phosphate O-acyltransferase